ncbi:hypothetical protein [Streptomyces sp. SID3343]|uniref:hypothetical protein n=1 Tax=Streptomyces sp. SID3343 TaxID=2690260 RepID=UPI001368CA68|nr:hypothetical protein [Streptomyces sp. SID3343]MYV96791.1 hypothetical protein [Streptomyces sp. SID3343]
MLTWLTWLVVGVAVYLIFLAGVIVVLRAAKARARAERATDTMTLVAPPAAVGGRSAPEALPEDDAGRGHPVTEEHGEPRPGDPGSSASFSRRHDGTIPPSLRTRG